MNNSSMNMSQDSNSGYLSSSTAAARAAAALWTVS